MSKTLHIEYMMRSICKTRCFHTHFICLKWPSHPLKFAALENMASPQSLELGGSINIPVWRFKSCAVVSLFPSDNLSRRELSINPVVTLKRLLNLPDEAIVRTTLYYLVSTKLKGLWVEHFKAIITIYLNVCPKKPSSRVTPLFLFRNFRRTLIILSEEFN